MPIYTFRSKNPKSPYFDKDFEILWSIKEYEELKDSLVCPLTGSKLLRSMSKGVAVKFKGSGFYDTDYKNK